MKNQMTRLLFFSLLLSLSGCGVDLKKSDLIFSAPKSPTTEEIKVDPNQTDAQFMAIQKNLIGASCLKCHNATQTKHSNLTSRDVVLKYADDILYRITDIGADKMPPRGDRVDPVVVQEFKTWKSDVQFASLQKNLFEVSCLKCHGPNQTRRSNLASKEMLIDNYDEILYRMTDAFEEDNKPMPPIGKGKRVSAELILEFQKWKDSL